MGIVVCLVPFTQPSPVVGDLSAFFPWYADLRFPRRVPSEIQRCAHGQYFLIFKLLKSEDKNKRFKPKMRELYNLDDGVPRLPVYIAIHALPLKRKNSS